MNENIICLLVLVIQTRVYGLGFEVNFLAFLFKTEFCSFYSLFW